MKTRANALSVVGTTPTRRKAQGRKPTRRKVVHEVNYKCEKKKTPLHLAFYLDPEERREVIKETNEVSCLLLEYYLRRAGPSRRIDEGEVTDDHVATYFGWKKQKAQRARRELTKHGWFRYLSFNAHQGRKSITYYIGKEAVRESYRT